MPRFSWMAPLAVLIGLAPCLSEAGIVHYRYDTGPMYLELPPETYGGYGSFAPPTEQPSETFGFDIDTDAFGGTLAGLTIAQYGSARFSCAREPNGDLPYNCDIYSTRATRGGQVLYDIQDSYGDNPVVWFDNLFLIDSLGFYLTVTIGDDGSITQWSYSTGGESFDYSFGSSHNPRYSYGDAVRWTPRAPAYVGNGPGTWSISGASPVGETAAVPLPGGIGLLLTAGLFLGCVGLRRPRTSWHVPPILFQVIRSGAARSA